MAEPKKGKFKYHLESVLKVRKIRETQQKEVFAEKQRIFYEELQREEELKNWQENLNTELKNSIVGEIKDFGSILRRRSHLVKVKEDVQTQEVKRVQAEKLKEQERLVLSDKMKDRKVMEKNKDKNKDAWKRLMEHEDTKFLDDIANVHFNRKTKQ